MFADADGATDYHEVTKIYKIVKQVSQESGKDLACAIGNRNSHNEVQRTGLRKLLNFIMVTLV